MVTAELAVGLLSAAVICALLAWTVGLMALHARCEQTATAIVRQLARGDQAAADAAAKTAPAQSKIESSRTGEIITVRVSTQRSLGPVGPVPISAAAQLSVEPGADEGR